MQQQAPPEARTRLSGVVTPLVLGLAVLTPGALFHSGPTLGWFIAVCDLLAVVCLAVVMALAGLEAVLRHDGRSLATVTVAAAGALMWVAHAAVFPGDLPAFSSPYFDQFTSWLYLMINLAVPMLLAFALLERPSRHVDAPRRAVLRAALAGIAIGCGVVALAAALAASPVVTVRADGGGFTELASVVGASGAVPSGIALAIFALGRRGDERVAGGVLGALILSMLASAALLLLEPRYSPIWYSAHLLTFMPNAALLAGQLSLYARSVRAEQRARHAADRSAARLQVGFDASMDLATQTDAAAVIDRLLLRASEVSASDRAVLLQLTEGGQSFTVEAAYDASEAPAQRGREFPLDSMRWGELSLVRSAVESGTVVRSQGYTVDELPEPVAAALRHLRHALTMPLLLGGRAVAVLVLARRRDPDFNDDEIRAVHQLAGAAALMLRNARLLDEARAASAAKTQFLNLAGHELRTPLAVIKGYLSMLGDNSLGELPEHMRGVVSVMERKADELGGIVEELLLAARIQGDRVHQRPEFFDLRVAAQAATARAAPRARLLGGSVVLEDGSGPITVHADPGDIARILDNLVNNAMTYTDDAPQVYLQVQADPPALLVRDRGRGIAPEHHSQVFDQFFRVEDPEFGYPSGTGLGLYISQQLALRNGADLELASSAPGEGSTFALRFPHEEAQG
jgi:signal transduction histidine kinase